MTEKELKIVVENVTYVVPEGITYRQYKHAGSLLQGKELPKLEVISTSEDGDEGEDSEVRIDMAKLVQMLFEYDVIPELLATILVPEGEIWKPDMLKNKDKFLDLSDTVIMEVFVNFLTGRVSLIGNIMKFLQPLLDVKTGFANK